MPKLIYQEKMWVFQENHFSETSYCVHTKHSLDFVKVNAHENFV